MTSAKDQFTDSKEYYKHVSLFWTDLIHLMFSKPQALASVGPMRNFAENAKKISLELLESNEDIAQFTQCLTNYYKQLNDTWIDAQKKVNMKIPEIPHDAEQFEAYKRIWIDIFDNDFTGLFDSKDFGENYGNLVSKEIDLTKRWNNIMNIVLQSANLPNKQDLDEVYKEIHLLRKKVTNLESKLNKGNTQNVK